MIPVNLCMYVYNTICHYMYVCIHWNNWNSQIGRSRKKLNSHELQLCSGAIVLLAPKVLPCVSHVSNMQLFQLKHASCTAGKLAIATYTFNEKSPNPMKRTRQSLYTILCTQYHFGYNGFHWILYNDIQWIICVVQCSLQRTMAGYRFCLHFQSEHHHLRHSEGSNSTAQRHSGPLQVEQLLSSSGEQLKLIYVLNNAREKREIQTTIQSTISSVETHIYYPLVI
jgi:hypothetical protein